MNQITIKEDLFWEWMNPADSAKRAKDIHFRPKSNNEYLILLSQMMEKHWDSIALGLNVTPSAKGANTLDKLSRQIPRGYFLEVQYCLASYASVFASLFPPMISHLDNLAYIEWLLYMEPDFEKYRDHLVHMFRVAFVCNRLMGMDVILNRVKDFQFASEHFLDWCKNIVNDDPRDWDDARKYRLLDAAIYISAIFHDFGYGYFYLNKYRERLSGILPSLVHFADPVDIYHISSDHLRKSLVGQFAKKYHYAYKANSPPANEDVVLTGFFRDCLCLNHSVASAIFIVDLSEQLRKRNAISDELYIAFHLASEAAMLHDMTKRGNWIHLYQKSEESFLCCKDQREIPLLALLSFADEVEIGSRPRMQRIVKDRECVYSVDDSKPFTLEIKYEDSKKYLNLISGKPGCFGFLAKSEFFSNDCTSPCLLDIPLEYT